MEDCIRIRSGGAVAEVSTRGAEILGWEVAGIPLLWTPQPVIWTETAPVLFPVVGWTRGGEVRVGMTTYPLGLHGFARHRRFAVADLSEDTVRLVLESDPETRALYPFDFRLCVTYWLSGPKLGLEMCVENRGQRDMPYACGWHPGFRWPLGGEKILHSVVFDREEEPHVPEITPQGLFSSALRSVPLEGRSLPLSSELFAKEALCFLDVKSRGLTYEAGDGSSLRFDMENFRHVALWSRPGGAFLAIELWTGHGDPHDFTGDLFAKPSMELLRPSETARHRAEVTFQR